MSNAWRRAGATIGAIGLLALAGCQAEVDTNPDEGGVRVDVEASENGTEAE